MLLFALAAQNLIFDVASVKRSTSSGYRPPFVAHTPPGTAQKTPGKRDDELPERLRNLLADRFQLVIHREMREMPVHLLTVAKNGPKLAAAEKREIQSDTGLTGFYRFDPHWAPDNLPDATGPSRFTAVQEQLGLKLEAKRRPVEVIVFDRVERPTEN